MPSLIPRSVPNFFVLLSVIDLNNDKSTFIIQYNHDKQGESLVHMTLDQVENVPHVVFCDDSCSVERSWFTLGILGGEEN